MAMNAGTIQQFLSGVDYPATRDELVDHAQSQGAPDDVMSVLENLPEREFNSPADLMAQVGGAMRSEESDEADEM